MRFYLAMIWLFILVAFRCVQNEKVGERKVSFTKEEFMIYYGHGYQKGRYSGMKEIVRDDKDTWYRDSLDMDATFNKLLNLEK